MIFTKGLKETLKFNFNPDEINFLYIYVGHQKHILNDVNYKSFWNVNLMSQVQLPSKIKFTATYNTSTTGGNYQYFVNQYPFSKQLDATFSKKFYNNNLSFSIYVNDILNNNKQSLGAIGTDLSYDNKNDSRRIGFSLNYKIPSKNKIPKDENILKKDIKEDENIFKD